MNTTIDLKTAKTIEAMNQKMAYIHSEKDVLKLVTALMTNTKKVRAATHSGTKRNGFCSFR